MNKIAVIGVACRLPGGVASLDTLWTVLASGRDVVTEIPPERFDVPGFSHPQRTAPGRSCTFAAGVLDSIEDFDFSFFGISKKEAEYMDPQQRLLLEMAWEVLEDAQVRPSFLSGTRTAVFIGSSSLDASMQRADDPCVIGPYSMIGNTLGLLSNRISYLLDIHGPSMTIDTACSASLVALHQACQAVASGEASMAIAGGVHMLCCPLPFIGFSKAHMLSKDGRCKVFAKDANGYARAEGGGLLLLKPLQKAIEDGDRIHAVIAKTGINTDGRTIGIAFPNQDAQMSLLRSIYDAPDIDLRNVCFMEAHGTGTTAGDPIEARAIGEVFTGLSPGRDPLLVGSVKSNLGHLEPASGMAGLLKAMLILKHKAIPPNLHLETANPDIDVEALRLRFVTELTPVPETPGPALVGVNSFGFGGANAHALLEEAPAPRRAAVRQPPQGELPPLLLSAQSPRSLRRLAKAYAELLRGADAGLFTDVACRAALRRDHLVHRLVLREQSVAGVVQALARVASDEAPRKEARIARGEILGGVVRTAFVFSGNGGRWPGMGRTFLAKDADAAAALDTLDAVMSPMLGWSIADSLLGDPQTQSLERIEVFQPMLLAIQVCLVEALRAKGVAADMVFGHSIGEVAAAWACGALSLEQACTVIVERSRLQSESRGLGDMAVVQLSEKEARALPEVHAGELEIAAVNSHRYVTLTGPETALESVHAALKKRRIVFRKLFLGHPFHSRAMEGIRDRLRDRLAHIVPDVSRIPFYSTMLGDIHPGRSLDAEYWWHNLRKPVLFRAAALAALRDGARIFIELGPDTLLHPFLKSCFQEQSATTVYLPSIKRGVSDGDVARTLWKNVHASGGKVDFTAFFPRTGPHVDLPAYPWDKEPCLAESTPECLNLFGAKPKGHPLLGHRVRPGLSVWENVLDTHLVPFLAEHVVGGDVVLPGAAYLEMALAAAVEAFGSPQVELENVEYRQPMTFFSGKGRLVRFTLSAEGGDFQIESRELMQSSAMVLHACGRVVPRLRKTLTPTPAPAPCGVEEDVPDLYRKAKDSGLHFGPAFRPLRQVWRIGDNAFARLDLDPKADMAEAVLHPCLIDGAFQMLLSLVDWSEKSLESHIYLPIRTGRFQLLHPGRVAYAAARLERQSRRGLAASFVLYDTDGHELARLKDCRFARHQTRENLMRQQQVYAMAAVLARHPLDASPTEGPPLPKLAELTAPALTALRHGARWSTRHDEVVPFFTALVLSQTCELVRSLAPDAAAFTLNQILRRGGIEAEHEPYLSYALHFLKDMGLARRDADRWTLGDSDLPPSLELWRAAVREYPEYIGELTLYGQAGEEARAILAGKIQAGSLVSLQPGGPVEQAFRTSPRHHDGHAAMVSVFKAITKALPEGAPLRILEVDAGAGGLTQALAPHLAPGDVEYLATDRDENFAEQLKARWAGHPVIRAGLFDLDDPDAAPPEADQAGGFDVILAGHVLHRLVSPSRALRRLHDLLRPGGLLVVLDTPPHPVRDLLHGLLPGWWREDAPSGPPSSRLMPSEEWTARLEAAGFLETRSLLGEAQDDVVLVAGRKNPAAPQPDLALPAKRWILFEDAAPSPEARRLAQALRDALRDHGARPVRVVAGTSYLAAATDDYTLDPESRGQWKQLLRALGGKDVILECIHLAGFDIRQDLEPQTLDDIQNRRVVSTVAMAQGWQKAKVPAGLCLVTGGGLPLLGRPSRPVPSQGALPGLCRVLFNEMPGLRARLVDIHADAQGALPLEAAVREILFPVHDLVPQGTSDKEVALSRNGRYCLRLAPLEFAALACPGEAAGEAVSLEMTAQGKLDGASWRRTTPGQPGQGQVLIDNKAAGVNYRDIMFTLGRIPEEALEGGASGPTLGLECAGTVLAVGRDVEGIAPGDTVCCLGGGCYDSRLVANADMVFPLPPGISPTRAATIPVAHFTAWYALTHLARLQPGERVLIHGAAGGVGLAAIQIATMIGAEVFATAGSPAKRTLLARLGAPHVLDSRSQDFEERILDITGGEGVDVVLNSISGESLQKSVGLLRPLGRFLELGKVDFYANSPLRMRLLRNNISFFGIDVDQVMRVQPQLCRRLFLAMLTHFETRDLWPLPHAVYPREAIAEAFRSMQQSRHIGKLVVEHDELDTAVLPAPPEELGPLPAQATYLVTGGLGGLGLAVAGRLADLGAGHLLLLGRNGAADQAQMAAIQELRTRGVTVTVVKADVANEEDLATAITQALSGLPPLRGVVHCAGILRDATIVNLRPDDIRAVLRTKALGGLNLHRITRSLPLDFFIMFSSATTVIGNPGQGNYVAANTMLENLAAYRRSLGLAAVTFGWGPVVDAGMLSKQPEILESLKALTGAQELRTATAMDHLVKYGRHPVCNLHVFKMNFKKLARLPYVSSPMSRYVALDTAGEQAVQEQADIREAVRGLSQNEAVTYLATLLSQNFAKILRVPVSKIRHDKPMGELGMDSLMYVELGLATEEAFGVDISTLSLDKTASILTLAELIHRQLEQPGGTPISEAETVSRHLKEIHGLDISPEGARDLIEDTARDTRAN
ncbi:type I polyketide synthase [Desulfolutivibrio sulfoxidireducens]|uniref:type I polyketide synthase n=1 Tax=Desulfolutivibrio sulfoxidireducens TaxID=2773299 RepID=UPI00159D73F3|nr:type I polyketide synthase [Desulfolutivibrio sulfoxidireducens]QLA17686.1 SDR family NAD(P)-dependent oxidoreductase [Desulfolutivibrio sulfoxidireducens]QLA21261.1 SDR family NAD(P)-dependent oxidoreductase [Desulfolutivibrio sulfoxidireducens]